LVPFYFARGRAISVVSTGMMYDAKKTTANFTDKQGMHPRSRRCRKIGAFLLEKADQIL